MAERPQPALLANRTSGIIRLLDVSLVSSRVVLSALFLSPRRSRLLPPSRVQSMLIACYDSRSRNTGSVDTPHARRRGILRLRMIQRPPLAPDGPARPDCTVPGPESRDLLEPYSLDLLAHGRETGKKRPRSPHASRQGPARRRKTVRNEVEMIMPVV
jgi:hypothetical protein